MAQIDIEATLESSSSYLSFNRSLPVAFDAGLIGSTCSALPSVAASSCAEAVGRLSAAAATAPRPHTTAQQDH